MEKPKKINSRWTRDPTLEKGKPVRKVVTSRTVEILKLLNRYRFLQSDDISALIGGSPRHIKRGLGEISRKPYCFINRPHQQRDNANANYSHLVYELDTPGATILREHGVIPRPKYIQRNFIHELMVNRIMASFELGVRDDPEAQLIMWADIIGSLPKKVRESENPHHIPFELKTKGASETAHIAADGLPFGIKVSNRYIFFPGIEADCGTEPISTGDYDRSSIQRKFLAYLDILDKRIFKDHFGFPILYVPFFFPTIARMESAMVLLERLTGSRQQLRRFFLFKTYPTLTSFGKQAPATGHVYVESFQRVAMAPFTISPKEAGNGHREVESAHSEARGD